MLTKLPTMSGQSDRAAADNDVTVFFVAIVAIFATGGALTLLHIPFPSQFDELQHYSFIVALREAPTLFPAYGTYKVLTGDLKTWSDAINYIAHPPLAYLLLAPLGDNILVLRAVNLAMAVAGFALCAQAGVGLLATRLQRIAYLLVLFAFSKPMLIAGMINNDNLVLLETGLLFWLVTRERARPVAVAIVLALLGWTKFNAFVGLVAMVGLLQISAIWRREQSLFGLGSLALAAGVAVGAIPTVANLVQLGVPAYVPVHFLYVEPSARPDFTFAQFASAFFHQIGYKFLFADGAANMLPALIVAALVAGAAMLDRTNLRARRIAVCAWLATLFFAAIHLRYGWNSFRTLGSMSDAQSRYYVMLWPGFALAIVMGASALCAMLPRLTRHLDRQTMSPRT